VVPGYHSWKEAPNIVKFLRDVHRHLFRIAVTVKVTNKIVDDNRQVEFFCLQNDIQSAIADNFEIIFSGWDFKNNSCENLAESVANYLKELGYSIYEVEVSEDDESSGIFRIE
jgi:hypothetical protein